MKGDSLFSALLLTMTEALGIAKATFSFQKDDASRSGKKGSYTSFSSLVLKWWVNVCFYWFEVV